MKKILLLSFLFVSTSSFSQTLKTEEIIGINTQEKNSKKVIFIKHNDIYFGIEAKNKTSKDFTKCKWITSFSEEDMLYFLQALKEIKNGVNIENSAFSIKQKKDKIIINIIDSRCTSEHRTHYFQKTCKRELTFIILTDDASRIVSALAKKMR